LIVFNQIQFKLFDSSSINNFCFARSLFFLVSFSFQFCSKVAHADIVPFPFDRFSLVVEFNFTLAIDVSHRKFACVNTYAVYLELSISIEDSVLIGECLELALVFISVSEVINSVVVAHLIQSPVSNIFIAVWESHFSLARSFAVEKLSFVDFTGAIFKYSNRADHSFKTFISGGLLDNIIL
jgi:hypothetical protein